MLCNIHFQLNIYTFRTWNTTEDVQQSEKEDMSDTWLVLLLTTGSTPCSSVMCHFCQSGVDFHLSNTLWPNMAYFSLAGCTDLTWWMLFSRETQELLLLMFSINKPTLCQCSSQWSAQLQHTGIVWDRSQRLNSFLVIKHQCNVLFITTTACNIICTI